MSVPAPREKERQHAIIARISGPVLTIRYPMGEPYRIHDLLVTESGVHLEVASHTSPGECRCIALEATYGLSCGMKVTNTHSCIQVPVGEQVLGRVVDVLGNPIDGGKPLEGERWGIYRSAPAYEDLSPKIEFFETGIKVIDLLTPTPRAVRSASLAAPALVRPSSSWSSSTTSPRSTAATPYSPA